MSQFENALQEVAERVLSGSNIEEWKKFMGDNDDCFLARNETKGEFSHESRDIHQVFVEMVENHLETALVGIGYQVSEFMTLCSEADKDESRGNGVQAFLELVLGCTDFIVFGDIMSDTNKRAYYFQMIDMW
eukprot:CAMPEP_0114349174 /NCGR_PEP_ID=MMETSP0101-20121206/15328_1 /TAXON_ID=38822 ORGANISM="Pteridomonas danica, Strain PT" /NCGR_SAMPLE_ID=MMETSP0101 /ASSEMBLY_ACC=CAM_ASM_000211 /LENGTH=131 /DNA_ID=CAMNT_0001487603 /DNA_START=6 /DNA_END=398 /DNA_ORIENTATION=+